MDPSREFMPLPKKWNKRGFGTMLRLEEVHSVQVWQRLQPELLRRYVQLEEQMARERAENDARLAAKAVAKLKEVNAEAGNSDAELREKERKRAIIAAAIERARQKADKA